MDKKTEEEQPKIEPILPNFGLTTADEQPKLMLCKPKLLPLKTYSYVRMQIQTKNQLDTQQQANSNN